MEDRYKKMYKLSDRPLPWGEGPCGAIPPVVQTEQPEKKGGQATPYRV
jgi:hypothetical protein